MMISSGIVTLEQMVRIICTAESSYLQTIRRRSNITNYSPREVVVLNYGLGIIEAFFFFFLFACLFEYCTAFLVIYLCIIITLFSTLVISLMMMIKTPNVPSIMYHFLCLNVLLFSAHYRSMNWIIKRTISRNPKNRTYFRLILAINISSSQLRWEAGCFVLTRSRKSRLLLNCMYNILFEPGTEYVLKSVRGNVSSIRWNGILEMCGHGTRKGLEYHVSGVETKRTIPNRSFDALENVFDTKLEQLSSSWKTWWA